MILRTCTRCDKPLELNQFKKDSRYRGGYTRICKNCLRQYDTEWHRKNKKIDLDKARKYAKQYRKKYSDKARSSQLKSIYGITLDDYNKIFAEQEGCCAICGRHQSELKRKLAIDHNHKTDEIRGLLCNNCNLGLGNFRVDSKGKSLLRKAQIYCNLYE